MFMLESRCVRARVHVLVWLKSRQKPASEMTFKDKPPAKLHDHNRHECERERACVDVQPGPHFRDSEAAIKQQQQQKKTSHPSHG